MNNNEHFKYMLIGIIEMETLEYIIVYYIVN